jgi:hypothetical protein
VEGPACEYKKNQGLFKEKGSAEPWILDPTAHAVVDHAVHPVHGSTMYHTQGAKGYAILTVRHRSHGSGLTRARNSGARAIDRGGAAALQRRITGVP